MSKSLFIIQRRCGKCTACCTVLEIHELKKPAHQTCINCSGEGCNIHADRPKVCRDFYCFWLRGDGLEEDRPDRIGIVFSREFWKPLGRHMLRCTEVWPGASEEPRPKAILAVKSSQEPVMVHAGKGMRLMATEKELRSIAWRLQMLKVINPPKVVTAAGSGAAPILSLDMPKSIDDSTPPPPEADKPPD